MFNPIGLIKGSVKGRLQPSFVDIVERISKQIEDIVADVLIAPTPEEFNRMRESFFPSYVQLSQALSHVVLAKLDQAELPSFIEDSFVALESAVIPEAASYFGEDAYQEILFSIGTMKRTYRWLPFVRSNKPEDSLRQRDAELACDFNTASMWADFHLEVLMTAAHKKVTTLPEILQELLDGLRLSVMAYSYIREALDLRKVPDIHHGETLDVLWDEEDEALANAD